MMEKTQTHRLGILGFTQVTVRILPTWILILLSLSAARIFTSLSDRGFISLRREHTLHLISFPIHLTFSIIHTECEQKILRYIKKLMKNRERSKPTDRRTSYTSSAMTISTTKDLQVQSRMNVDLR
ncbi:hypothetical protein RYX36_016896 [Vicia faba]